MHTACTLHTLQLTMNHVKKVYKGLGLESVGQARHLRGAQRSLSYCLCNWCELRQIICKVVTSEYTMLDAPQAHTCHTAPRTPHALPSHPHALFMHFHALSLTFAHALTHSHAPSRTFTHPHAPSRTLTYPHSSSLVYHSTLPLTAGTLPFTRTQLKVHDSNECSTSSVLFKTTIITI
jgi:hypothetical protein